MIVNEYKSYFEMIPQHEHARISYEILKNWGDRSVEKSSVWEALLLAVREHDRAWIPLDASPIMNKEQNKPYSFTDYPEKEKITAYQQGIQTVVKKNAYSGLLNSLHYASFFKNNTSKKAVSFLKEEEKRQEKLRELQTHSEESFHLRLLQFCDDLSLYACMNDPGAREDEEISWFKNGFRHTFEFLDYKTIQAQFISTNEIQLTPFPLRSPLKVTIHGKAVKKTVIAEENVDAAFQSGEEAVRNFSFVP
ncbi:DUF3891 family protein [Alteribacillus bidgolensis]|uniref:DUF3891 domain-containing protein n=1 Tax=Alteribacillus bidgolensis TaxID=930129 RepID=A0A1G8CBC8_9BACI|nr:DUF3891 family protein [Alteribacillus bidgolensis]SDH42659.1 Protein of unknown function [Alteribacillus bidgolensis]